MKEIIYIVTFCFGVFGNPEPKKDQFGRLESNTSYALAVKKDVCDNKIFTNDSLAFQFYKEALNAEGIFDVAIDTVIVPEGFEYKIFGKSDNSGWFVVLEPEIIVEKL